MAAIEPTVDMPEPAPGLTRNQFWIILAVVVTQFLFFQGIVWQHLWDLDRSILYSYATIPVLVALVLAWHKRLRWGSAFLATIELISAKFVVTALFVMIALIVHGGPKPPQPAARAAPVHVAAPEAPARVPSVIPPERLGQVSGRVTRGGQPAAGVLVWVDGVDDLVFAPATEPLLLSNDGTGFSPRLAVAEVGQPIDVRSTNGRLHTLAGEAGHDRVFNNPVLASGAPQRVVLREGFGLVTLTCTVAEGRESPSRLLVVPHPFHAFTDAAGKFTLIGVPAGSRRLAVLDPAAVGAPRLQDVVVGGGATSQLAIALP